MSETPKLLSEGRLARLVCFPGFPNPEAREASYHGGEGDQSEEHINVTLMREKVSRSTAEDGEMDHVGHFHMTTGL